MLTALFRYLFTSFVNGGKEEEGTLEEQAAKKVRLQRVRNRDKNHDKKR